MTDLRMSLFTLRVFARSMRWVAPAIIYLLAGLLVVANPGPVLANAVVMFPVHAVVACWLTVAIGNVDDDGHRELCTAIVGSPGRLLVDRSLAAFLVTLGTAIVTTLALALGSSPRPGSALDLAACGGAVLAGGMVGTGVGALLHRPILRHIGLAVVTATAALTVAMVAPPTIRLLRGLEAGDDLAALYLFGGAALGALVLNAVAHRMAGPRARFS